MGTEDGVSVLISWRGRQINFLKMYQFLPEKVENILTSFSIVRHLLD